MERRETILRSIGKVLALWPVYRKNRTSLRAQEADSESEHRVAHGQEAATDAEDMAAQLRDLEMVDAAADERSPALAAEVRPRLLGPPSHR